MILPVCQSSMLILIPFTKEFTAFAGIRLTWRCTVFFAMLLQVAGWCHSQWAEVIAMSCFVYGLFMQCCRMIFLWPACLCLATLSVCRALAMLSTKTACSSCSSRTISISSVPRVMSLLTGAYCHFIFSCCYIGRCTLCTPLLAK